MQHEWEKGTTYSLAVIATYHFALFEKIISLASLGNVQEVLLRIGCRGHALELAPYTHGWEGQFPGRILEDAHSIA